MADLAQDEHDSKYIKKMRRLQDTQEENKNSLGCTQ